MLKNLMRVIKKSATRMNKTQLRSKTLHRRFIPIIRLRENLSTRQTITRARHTTLSWQEILEAKIRIQVMITQRAF